MSTMPNLEAKVGSRKPESLHGCITVDNDMFQVGSHRGSIGGGHSLSAGRGLSNSGTHWPMTFWGSVPARPSRPRSGSASDVS